jgi:DnaJ-class molecular chaperone
VAGGGAVKPHSLNSLFDKVIEDFQEGLAQYAQEILQKSMDTAKLGQLGDRTSFDSYMVLGLSQDCSDDEVKRRFRELARILHPDTSTCQGTEFLFMLVNLSYEHIAKERQWR